MPLIYQPGELIDDSHLQSALDQNKFPEEQQKYQKLKIKEKLIVNLL